MVSISVCLSDLLSGEREAAGNSTGDGQPPGVMAFGSRGALTPMPKSPWGAPLQ